MVFLVVFSDMNLEFLPVFPDKPLIAHSCQIHANKDDECAYGLDKINPLLDHEVSKQDGQHRYEVVIYGGFAIADMLHR